MLLYPVFFTVTFILLRLARIDITEHSLSYLGATPVYGIYFDIALVVGGGCQLVILLELLFNRKVKVTILNMNPLLFLTSTTIMGILTGIITNNVSKGAHFVIAAIGFFSAFLGWTLLGLALLRMKRRFSGLLMVVFGCVMMPILMYVGISAWSVNAMIELIFFLAAYITNLVIYEVYLR